MLQRQGSVFSEIALLFQRAEAQIQRLGVVRLDCLNSTWNILIRVQQALLDGPEHPKWPLSLENLDVILSKKEGILLPDINKVMRPWLAFTTDNLSLDGFVHDLK